MYIGHRAGYALRTYHTAHRASLIDGLGRPAKYYSIVQL